MSPRSPAEWWRPDVATRAGVRRATAGVEPGGAFAFRAVLALMAVVVLAPQEILPALAPLRLALVTSAVAVGAHLVDVLSHRRPLTVVTREVWIIGGLLGWAVLTLPFSYWPGGSVAVLLDLYLKTLIVFWLLANTVTTVGRLRRVAWALSLMSVPLAVVAVTRYLSGTFMEGSVARRIVGYEGGLTENPNDLALMLNLILPLALALFVIDRRPIVRGALAVIVALDVIAVILTLSRAGFVTLMAMMGLYLWRTLGRRGRGRALAGLMAGLALVCLPFLPAGYVDRVSTITDISADPTGSAQVRWNDTLVAVSRVIKHPIVGAGIGVDGLAMNEERGPQWSAVHNVYLQYAVGLGLPGLALFVWLLRECFKSVRQAGRAGADSPHLFHLAEGIEVGLAGFAVAAMFYPVAYHLYFYYLAGLAVAAKLVADARPAA
jgi:putative inorganic carbon (hco3(-)) transporter